MTTEMAQIHRRGMARCFDAWFLHQCGIADWDVEGFDGE
jgi:hypothetical protein